MSGAGKGCDAPIPGCSRAPDAFNPCTLIPRLQYSQEQPERPGITRALSSLFKSSRPTSIRSGNHTPTSSEVRARRTSVGAGASAARRVGSFRTTPTYVRTPCDRAMAPQGRRPTSPVVYSVCSLSSAAPLRLHTTVLQRSRGPGMDKCRRSIEHAAMQHPHITRVPDHNLRSIPSQRLLNQTHAAPPLFWRQSHAKP